MDEVNAELMKKVQKADGDIIVMLIRKERMESFHKLWVDTNRDYYQTQVHRKKVRDIQ